MKNDLQPLDVTEASEYLGCSVGLLRKLISKRKIPHRKVGAKIVFDIPVLEAYKKNSYIERGFKYEL